MTTIVIDSFACPGWARARTSKGRYYTDKKTKAAKDLIEAAWFAKTRTYITGPVSVHIHAEYAPPASWSKRQKAAAIGKWKPTKPDLDNVIKLVLDALSGAAFDDDKSIADLGASKTYGESDRLIITVKDA